MHFKDFLGLFKSIYIRFRLNIQPLDHERFTLSAYSAPSMPIMSTSYLRTCAAKINDFVIVGDHVDSVQHFSIPAWSSADERRPHQADLNGIFMWKRRFKIRKSHWKILNFMFYQSRFHILLDLKRSVQFWCLKVGRFKIGKIHRKNGAKQVDFCLDFRILWCPKVK